MVGSVIDWIYGNVGYIWLAGVIDWIYSDVGYI